MKNVIAAENIDVGYEGKKIVEKIDIHGLKGQLICLMGPNGAGKSTILRTLTGLIAPVKGTVYIDGNDIRNISKMDLAKKLSVVLTEQVSLELLTVYEIVSMGRYPYTNFMGRLTREDNEIIEEALHIVNAENLRDRRYSQLSDGEKQKIMIARALVQQPELIVLDEPTNYLDVKHKVEIINILHKLCMDKGITVILSLHDIDLAIKGCQTILLIKNGKIVSQGAPEEVIKTGTIQKLYDIKGAQYDELLGSLEFCSPNNYKIFITGGNGTGARIYRAVSRAGYGMYCGILHSNDIDARIGKSLRCRIIEETAFNEISDKNFEIAKEKIKSVNYVIDTGFPAGSINKRNIDLIIEAVRMGKTVFSFCNKDSMENRYGELAGKIHYCSNTTGLINYISNKSITEKEDILNDDIQIIHRR